MVGSGHSFPGDAVLSRECLPAPEHPSHGARHLRRAGGRRNVLVPRRSPARPFPARVCQCAESESRCGVRVSQGVVISPRAVYPGGCFPSLRIPSPPLPPGCRAAAASPVPGAPGGRPCAAAGAERGRLFPTRLLPFRISCSSRRRHPARSRLSWEGSVLSLADPVGCTRPRAHLRGWAVSRSRLLQEE